MSLFVINYCSDMFRPQLSAIFREFESLLMPKHKLHTSINVRAS